MNKKLFTQIKNEWQSNLWLAIELLLVSVVMWFVVDACHSILHVYTEPRGFDTEHCYLIEMGQLTDKSADYRPRTNDETSEDVSELAERLRRRPEVEAVSLSINSYPYNGSNSWVPVRLEGDTLEVGGSTIYRRVSPDFVKVFRYQGINGETPEQLAEVLERDELLISDNLFTRKYNRNMSEFVGRRFHLHNDTTHSFPLGASLQAVRYTDFMAASGCRTVVKKNNYWDAGSELCVRVRADQDQDFIARLKADSESQYRIGNIFISDVRSFKDLRRNIQQYQYNTMRNLLTVLVFLLVNVFLGLLGTFWFRTQQRRCEIALHKAHGSSDWGVFSRLVSEGWLLLLIVTPIALLIDFSLANAELNSRINGEYFSPDRLILCAAVSFVLIALMIAIGIGVPARKAMKVQPAEALHDE